MSARRHAHEEGSALIELALLLPVLTGIFLGIVGLSFAISEATTVSHAAEAGALYGSLAGNNTDITGMQTAATNAAAGVPHFSATATTWCSCSAGGAASSCAGTCGGSSPTPFAYVQVKTTATVPMLTNYPGLSSIATLNGLSILRVH